MPRTILIVDDNEINRQLLINVLSKDYDIIEAEDGQQAISLMHRNYKLLSAVLLDIIMPVMDGYEVLRQARENIILSQIPIIVVTGTEDEDSQVRALSLGANDFILKPFNPDVVKHCLRNNISLRETASILNAIQNDKLTGLYNRDTFLQKTEALIKSKEPGYYILSCFDIDNFKLINDQYGAAEGDRILKEIGQTIKAYMDGVGGLAGRISADNFAALFPAVEKGADILQGLQDKNLVTVERKSIVFSIGRYIITDTSLPASAIYDRAYIAKQSVKGRYDKHMAYFDEVMLKKLVRDQQIISEMEDALADRQFEIWFQPQYNHVSGTLIGAEVLARWRHPQKGVVLPGEFIPLFEQNGFIYELDKFVWREACRYLRKWLDEGYTPLPISVNVSRYDIFRADLVDVITGLVEEFDLPMGLLNIEITESVFATSTKVIVQIVKKLISLGFTVEIDDFGSGYSSLNTLKSVPAQVLKLDMRFLEDDDDAQRGGNILQSIIRMANWLGISVIAEGVETKEQGDFLKSIGCSYVQGYYYARPMPASEYEKLCRDARREERLRPLATVDNLDNDLFWDPRSMDTLIFNSYVGAACIYEYHKGKVELLRANAKFAAILGDGAMSVEDMLKLDWLSYLTPESLEKGKRFLSQSDETGEDFSGEYVLLDFPGGPQKTYLHITMRVIASAGHRRLVYCICENITAQRQAEQSERMAVKQLQAVMDNVSCGITAFTMSGDDAHFLLTNDKYFEMLGYTREQHQQEVGDKAIATIYPEDRQRVARILAQVNATGVPAALEFRAIRRDGAIVWLRGSTSMTSFEGIDEPVQISAYTDITPEKNAAQELLDNLPCGAALYEYDGEKITATHLNKRYWELVDHVPVDFMGVSVLEAVHPDDVAVIRDELSSAISEGRDIVSDIRLRYGQEGYRPFHVVGRLMPQGDGKYSICASYSPISDQTMSIQEMLPVALEIMMASSSDLSFIKDKDLRYICCSRALAQMVGLKDETEMVGKTDHDIFAPEFADHYMAVDLRLIENGESVIDMVEHIPAADGEPRYCNISKYLLKDTWGNVVGIYGTGRDITQVRDAEYQQEFLINNIPGGVAIYEGQWSTLDSIKLTYFSDGFCKLFGYTREEYEKMGKENPTSLVSAENIPELVEQIDALVKHGKPMDLIYRARIKNGEHRWIHIKAVLSERRGDNVTVNAVLFDVTEGQNALEQLRISEEENRLAIRHSGNVVCRFNVDDHTLKVPPTISPIYGLEQVVEDVPYGQVKAGNISPETVTAYVQFYESIMAGEESCSVIYQRRSELGWRWIEAQAYTIFSRDGRPVSAVISFLDATESHEKEAAYQKWIQSLRNKDPRSYALFRSNVSKKIVYDSMEGSLMDYSFDPELSDFDRHVEEYVANFVEDEDKERFSFFLNVDSLLERYYGGDRISVLEYREKLKNGDHRWLRLTVDLVEYMHSADVEAYLLFEDIDEAKRAELLTLERAESDPLTGVLNRTAFAEKVGRLIAGSDPHHLHALLMLDIDGFKQVNDVFGHSAGDQALIDIANLLRTILRRDDLVARLGGDEFVVFLNDIPNASIATNKAKQICDLTRKAFSADVQISGSVGIALWPQDGADFEALYKKSDETLYHVKDSGRDNYAFYNDDMKEEHLRMEAAAAAAKMVVKRQKKCRMLIVDDNKMDFEMLANMFRDEFMIERASDGNAALIRLRHYGSAISVVLLDLIMPGMDGFAVLEKMQQSTEMRNIPVVVVSGDEDRETSLKAIRCGATDFVMKPVDPDVLQIRVRSAISKADNERLRAKNSFLELQNSETIRYKTVLDRIGLVVVEMDWGAGSFTYSSNASQYLWGKYDSRTLWHILLSDLVTDAHTVKRIQQYIHSVADDRSRMEGSMTVQLKTASKEMRPFCINIYKLANEFGLTDKIILTFREAEAEQQE